MTNLLSQIYLLGKIIIFVFTNFIDLIINDIMLIYNGMLSLNISLSGLGNTFFSIINTIVLFTGVAIFALILIGIPVLIIILSVWRLINGGSR